MENLGAARIRPAGLSRRGRLMGQDQYGRWYEAAARAGPAAPTQKRRRGLLERLRARAARALGGA